MKHVLQTRQEKKEHQNCLNAAIASILELPIEAVPEFNKIEDIGAWWHAAQDWAKTIGFQLLHLNLNQHTTLAPILEQVYCVLVGPNRRGILHAVVGYVRGGIERVDFMIHHDPADGDGIESVDSVIFLLPVNPERFVHAKKF